jgi:multiple sugar transport system substrate-binding protein
MVLGYRDLVPELREQPNLTFDVMPLPKISSGATIATMSGLCISSASKHTDAAADFLTDVVSDAGASVLARTGYVMPSNLDVVNGEDFLQTGQRPLHSSVFTREVRDTQLLPSTPRWPVVRRVTARDLTQLFYEPVIQPLEDRLKAIDEASIVLFDPSKATPSPSPSTSP